MWIIVDLCGIGIGMCHACTLQIWRSVPHQVPAHECDSLFPNIRCCPYQLTWCTYLLFYLLTHPLAPADLSVQSPTHPLLHPCIHPHRYMHAHTHTERHTAYAAMHECMCKSFFTC